MLSPEPLGLSLMHGHISCTFCKAWPWACSAPHDGELNAAVELSLREQDLRLAQATLPERPVCRRMYGSSVPSRMALPNPIFIPSESPCPEAGRLRDPPTPPRLDKPEIRGMGLASVTQWTVPPFLIPGAQHSEESPPCLAAEGLGLKVLVFPGLFPTLFMLG